MYNLVVGNGQEKAKTLYKIVGVRIEYPIFIFKN